MQEEFKELDGYQISNLGRVKNSKGKFISIYLSKKGYQKVSFNGTSKFVHRLVALLFCDNPEGKPQVNHIDGVKTNNIYTNLEWVTNAENQLHAWRMGLQPRGEDRDHATGERVANSVLTEEIVIRLRKEFNDRESFIVEASKQYGVHRSAIQSAIFGRTWKHLPNIRIQGEKLVHRGADNPISKLNDDLVRQLRLDWDGTASFITAKAKALGINRRTLGFAIRGETWKHVI